MGATSSKQPSPLQKEPPSTSLKIKPTETQLVSGYENNNMPTQPRKILESDSKTAALFFSTRTTHSQTDKQSDTPVMLKYSVQCKNEHSEPVDIVLVDERTKISSIVREKILPGSSASFEVLVFKESFNGKVYVRV